jgi:hypothetical protein
LFNFKNQNCFILKIFILTIFIHINLIEFKLFDCQKAKKCILLITKSKTLHFSIFSKTTQVPLGITVREQMCSALQILWLLWEPQIPFGTRGDWGGNELIFSLISFNPEGDLSFQTSPDLDTSHLPCRCKILGQRL